MIAAIDHGTMAGMPVRRRKAVKALAVTQQKLYQSVSVSSGRRWA